MGAVTPTPQITKQTGDVGHSQEVIDSLNTFGATSVPELNVAIESIDEAIKYTWDNAAARGAQGGMVEGEKGLQIDTKAVYWYESSVWVFKYYQSRTISGIKNILINGDMRFSERGDFTSASAAISGIYYLDRMKTSLVTVTADKQHISTSQPIGTSGESLKIIATSTASGMIGFYQIAEEYNLYKSKTITMSAWVKSNTADARLLIYDGVDISGSTGHTGGGGWEKLTVTHIVNASATTLQGYVRIQSITGGNVSITSGDYIEGTQMQLELGSVATDFEMRPIGLELALCQRYYYRFNAGTAITMVNTMQCYSTTAVLGDVMKLPVPMRTIPTVAMSAVAHFTPTNAAGGAAGALTGGAMVADTPELIRSSALTGSSGLVSGNATILRTNTTSAWIEADAEL